MRTVLLLLLCIISAFTISSCSSNQGTAEDAAAASASSNAATLSFTDNMGNRVDKSDIYEIVLDYACGWTCENDGKYFTVEKSDKINGYYYDSVKSVYYTGTEASAPINNGSSYVLIPEGDIDAVIREEAVIEKDENGWWLYLVRNDGDKLLPLVSVFNEEELTELKNNSTVEAGGEKIAVQPIRMKIYGDNALAALDGSDLDGEPFRAGVDVAHISVGSHAQISASTEALKSEASVYLENIQLP